VNRRPVEDDEGTRYLLLKRSGESSLVRNVDTGERTHLPNDQLEPAGESTVDTLVSVVPDEVRRLVTAVHEDRSLALLLELDAEGPMAVRDMLDAYDFCESDLHGLLGELRAAGLVIETTVAGERGYDTTEMAATALEKLQE
jgi:hypothetical protein